MIEEDDSLCVLLERLLGDYFSVEPFTNGIEALAWLSNRNKADLILTDLMMKGISGFDFLENIRSSGIFGEIPVIVLSDNDPDKENACVAMGVFSYVTKPFNPETLIELIHSVSNHQSVEKISET